MLGERQTLIVDYVDYVDCCGPIPMASRSKAWIYRRSLAGMAGSNPASDMDIFLLCVLCVVR